MIVYFFSESLPRFFRWLYALFCDSALCRFCARAWHAVVRAASNSLILGGLFERADEGAKTSGSRIMGAIDRFVAWIVKILRKVIGALTFGSFSCIFTRILAKLRELYTFLDYEFFTGICICFIILCPGERWSNVYGLVISLVLLVVLLILQAAGKRDRISISCIGAAFFAFLVSTAAGVLTASNRADALRVSIFFFTSFIIAIDIAATATDPKKLKKILGFIYAAVVATSLYAFYQRAMGVEVSASLTDLTLNAAMPGRVFSTFENPNNYAEFLILTIPMCVAFCSMLKRSWTAFVAWVLAFLPVAALLMTYSRSGWVSFAIAAVVFVFLYNKKLIPALILVGILAVPLLPSSVMARISTIGSTDDSSNMYRIYIWEGVLKMLRANWFTGIGLGPESFRELYITVCNPRATPAPHSHMLFLEIWLEQGLVGIVTYFAMVFSAIRRSVIAMKYADKGARITLIAGVSSLCGIAFASAAEYIWFYPRVMVTYFMVLGVLYACINISRAGRQTMKIED